MPVNNYFLLWQNAIATQCSSKFLLYASQPKNAHPGSYCLDISSGNAYDISNNITRPYSSINTLTVPSKLLPILYYTSNISKCSCSSLITSIILKLFQNCHFSFVNILRQLLNNVFSCMHKSSCLNSMKCSYKNPQGRVGKGRFTCDLFFLKANCIDLYWLFTFTRTFSLCSFATKSITVFCQS